MKKSGTTVTLLFSFAVLMKTTEIFGQTTDGCEFPKHNKKELEAYQKLKPLIGKRYNVPDPFSDQYMYHVGVCTPAIVGEVVGSAGAIQIEKGQHGGKDVSRDLGNYKKADIITGSDWIYLEYLEGKKYNTHCGGETRRAVIMFTCDETASDSNPMILLEENRNKSAGCYYLFELNTKDVCPGLKTSSLSLGSIFIIVFFSVIAVYLLFGFLYQRFVLGAKGMEQIPNYGFWQDFGNLQADGCNFLCRSGENRGPRSYKGVGDDQLEEVEERDDNLLPM